MAATNSMIAHAASVLEGQSRCTAMPLNATVNNATAKTFLREFWFTGMRILNPQRLSRRLSARAPNASNEVLSELNLAHAL